MESNVEVSKIKKLIGKKNIVKRYLIFIAAVFIMAATYNLFILPNDLALGGASGIAVITQKMIDPALMVILINIGLMILSFKFLGREKTTNTILGVFLYPLFIKLTANISSIITLEVNDLLLNVIFAGFLMGIASGYVLKYGFSTGGSDTAVQILSKYLKMSLGKCYLIIDGIIIVISGLYFNNAMIIMYAVIMLYIYSIMADKILLGISNNKAFYIITDKEDEVKEYVLKSLNHGVTILKAKGGYGGHRENVLLCVVPARQYFKLREGIALIDKDAFFVVTDAYEVKGGA